MKKLIEKGLDAVDRRNERREERMDAALTAHVEAMSHRPTLKRYIYLLAGVNLLLWATVVMQPYDVLTAFNKVAAVNDKIVALFLIVIFAIGMWLTYALFRLKYPDLESRSHEREVMSAYADNQNSMRKVRIWVVSVAGGVVNLLALAITEGLLVSNVP